MSTTILDRRAFLGAAALLPLATPAPAQAQPDPRLDRLVALMKALPLGPLAFPEPGINLGIGDDAMALLGAPGNAKRIEIAHAGIRFWADRTCWWAERCDACRGRYVTLPDGPAALVALVEAIHEISPAQHATVCLGDGAAPADFLLSAGGKESESYPARPKTFYYDVRVRGIRFYAYRSMRA